MYIFDYNHILMDKYYRKEIDGLRSIAVLGVLIYHVEFFLNDQKIFSGGFFGVDIFFVISGYLISKLIINELSIENKFNFRKFYFRRAKRILPALYLMIFVSFIFGWFYLTPKSFLEYSNSITSSVFFFSNYFFFFQGLEYNSESSFLKPLLHTWSLSVEEQFYIFFPVLLILSYKFKKSLYLILSLVIIFFLISFLTSIYNTSFSFYSSTSRFWELLAGTLVVFIEKKEIKFSFNKKLSNLGIILIFLSYLLLDNQILHPSYFTLLPVIGTCLIILFINKDQFIYKILTSSIFTKIGLWSYSLYLWHYPIFAFARNRGKSLSDFDKLELILLTFVLSILSFYLFEKPIRKLTYARAKIFLTLLSMFTILLIAINFFSIKTNGFDDRVHVVLKSLARENLWEKMKDEKGMCFDRHNEFCNFNNSSDNSIVLVGDSHAEVISYNLYEQINGKYNFISMNRSDCIYLPNVKKTKLNSEIEYKNCSIQSKLEIENILNNIKNSYIVIVGNYKKHFQKKLDWNYEVLDSISLSESFEKSLYRLMNNKNNNKVILVYPIPSLPYDITKKIMNEVPKSSFNASIYLEKNPYMTNYEIHKNLNKEVVKIFDNLNHKNLIKVFPDKVFCDKDVLMKCFAHKGSKIYYSDNNHLSYEGSKILNKLIISKVILDN